MRVHRVYIIQVQKVVQNECFDRNENPKKLTQKWLVSNKFYNGIMWEPVWTRPWTKLIRISTYDINGGGENTTQNLSSCEKLIPRRKIVIETANKIVNKQGQSIILDFFTNRNDLC